MGSNAFLQGSFSAPICTPLLKKLRTLRAPVARPSFAPPGHRISSPAASYPGMFRADFSSVSFAIFAVFGEIASRCAMTSFFVQPCLHRFVAPPAVHEVLHHSMACPQRMSSSRAHLLQPPYPKQLHAFPRTTVLGIFATSVLAAARILWNLPKSTLLSV